MNALIDIKDEHGWSGLGAHGFRHSSTVGWQWHDYSAAVGNEMNGGADNNSNDGGVAPRFAGNKNYLQLYVTNLTGAF